MKNIAVMIETSRAYGRTLMEGIAAHAQEAGESFYGCSVCQL